MKNVVNGVLLVLLLFVIGAWAMEHSANTALKAKVNEQRLRIDEQVLIIKEAEILAEKYKILEEQYNEVHERLENLIKNKKLLVALDPVADRFSPEGLEDLITEIGTGSVLRSPVSVTAQFGESVGYHGKFRMNHTGADLIPQNGDLSIVPYAAGEVVVCTIDPIYGKTLIIQHSERLRTKYSHGEMIYYRADLGEYVGPDDVIMEMGDTGMADGVHLHFELQVKVGMSWVPINPRPFLLQSSPEP